MTKQQKTDLQLWKQDQSQKLPKSLENLLIERCLEELESDDLIDRMCNFFGKEVVRIMQPEFGYNYIAFCHPDDTLSSHQNSHYCRFSYLLERVQKEYLQFFLSKTPDGQAVVPFLDEVCYNFNGGWNFIQNQPKKEQTLLKIMKDEKEARRWLMTLGHLLYRQFTEALRVGKTFDQALEKITKTYLLNLYA